jgi:RimJ/RimL family protein N-acetyltransferase
MKTQPRFQTERLLMRPISPSDAAAIQSTASLLAIADTMISIPHPYPHDEAQRFISHQMTASKAGHCHAFVIESRIRNEFFGIIEIRDIEPEHSQAELSFWLTPDAWGDGYMSEALKAIVCFAFESLELNRLYAYHMMRNPGSGRVLQKNGFVREGVLRQRVRKWDVFEDVALWARVKEDWQRGGNGVKEGSYPGGTIKR